MPRDLLADWPTGGQSPVPARPPRDLLEDLPQATEPALPKPESEAKPAPGSSWLKEQYGGLRRTLEYGVRSGAESFYRTLDDAATIVSRVTGLPKGGIFQKLAENVAPSKEIEPKGLAEEILAALYRAPVDIGTYLSVGRAVGGGPTAGFALTGAIRGGAQEGPEGALREGAKGALLGGILKAAGELRPLLRVPTLAGVFGGQTALEGGQARDVAREAAVGGIFGLMPSGRPEPWRPSAKTRVPVRQEPPELGRIPVREEPSGKEPEIRLRERPVEEPVEKPVEKPAERPPRDLLAEEPAQEALEFARPEEQPAEVPPRRERAQREREPRGPIWVRENLPPERIRVPRERKAREQNALAELARPEQPAPIAEPEPQAMPQRTADTMSEAIALSSPSGWISKKERQIVQERIRDALFGEKGLLKPQPGWTPEPEALERRAAELRELASRGMSPRKFQRLASQLEQKAWEIRQGQGSEKPPQAAAVPPETTQTPQRPASIRDQIVQAYRERETKGTEGAFEIQAIDSKAERLATLWDKLGQGWKEARTVAKSFRRADPADIARQLKELSDLGFVQIAWNPKGEPYYSRKGTPRVQGLLTEEEIEAVERAARATEKAQPEPSGIVPRAEPQPAIPEKGEIRLPQSVRDAYIEAQLSAHKPAAERGKAMQVVLSGGPPGAGKSAATKAFGLRKDDFVVADPDLHKKNLGFEDRAADFHEESSTINKQLVDRALDRGVNLLYDSLLSNYPLAEKLITEARNRGAKVFIAFTHIDPLTSQVRSELRYRKHLMGMSEAEGASPRRIPVEASVKGYNASLPTFIELYKRFGDDPDIAWSLVDNNVDGRPPKPIFTKANGVLTVFDQKEFDNLMGTEYTTNGKTGEDLRYVRKDKASSEQIRRSRGLIERRVNEQLNNVKRASSGRDALAVQVPLGSAASEPRTVRFEQEEARREVEPAPEATSERPSKSTSEAVPADLVPGDATSIKHPEGEDPAIYAAVDADALVPSHDMRVGFAPNPKYPKNVQERPYHRDRLHQNLVLSRTMPKAFEPRFLVSDNPDAINGPPIATRDRVVLGGNSRAMLLQYVYDRVPESAEKYRRYLEQNASRFGLDPERIKAMSKPVLVRILDVPLDQKDMARRVRKYNEPLTQALETKAEGVSKARLVSDETIRDIAEDLEEFDTLREYLSSPKSRRLIKNLVSDGVLERTQASRIVNQDTAILTEEGKRLVESVLRGTVIDDLSVLDAMPGSALQKLDRILPLMARLRARGEGWDISDPLKAAFSEYSRMKAQGMTLNDYLAIEEMFSESRKEEPKVRALLRALDSMKPLDWTRAFREFTKAAELDVAKQETFSFVEVETPEQAFGRIFGATEPLQKAEAFQARLDSIIGTESPPPAPVGLHIRPVAASSSGTSTGGVPATPARVAAARGLHKALGSGNTVVGLARKALEFARSAGRVYRALPPETTKEVPALKEGNKLTTFSKKVSFRQTLEQLRQLRADYEVAQTNAVRLFRGLTRDLHPEDVPLFYDAVVSSDLAYEAGRRSIDQMPFGLTKDEALKWKEEVDRAVAQNPRVKEALERRRRAYKAIADELIDAKILKEEQIYELDENGDRVRMKNEDYLHHQVLQYANFEVGPFGKGKKVQKPRPGYAKARSLKSTLDYNTDVFEADVMHMTRALYDIRRARRFESLMEEHDIADYLKALAKKADVKDWKELIPDGYEVRQYDPGRTFFHAESLPEKIVREILEGPGATVLPGDLRTLLAVGRKNREYVIPSELVETFEAMTRPQEYGPVKKAARALTTVWKKSVLLLPRRIVRYNWQNMIGDLDAAIAGAPAILKEIKSSARDLYSFYHGTTAPKDVQDAFERAVLSSTLTFEEIPSVSDLRVFDNIPETPGRRDWNLLSRYMRTAGRWTTYRENLLRLASYRYFLKRFEAGDYSNIGASVRKDVMALPDVKDRAAKVARELIGDYGAISEIGRDLRQSALPFYSWLEVNLRRYKRLIENSFTESRLQGTQTAARLSALVGTRVSAKMLSAWVKMLFLTSAVHLYNQLTASESEATLNDYDRRRLHLNLTPIYRLLGGDPDKTVILRGQSAFGDLLEWIGVNDVVASLDDWKRGTYGGKDAAKDILKAPVNKIVGALNPFYRALYEALTGVRLFPDVTRPGYTKGTLGTRLPLAVAEMFTLGEEWKALTHILPGLEPIPMRNYAENWSQAVFTSKDVDEQAYSYIQDRKARYLEQHGLGGRAVSNSPRSIALYNYRKARLYKDLEAERYWMQKLVHMSGSPKEALESVRRSAEYLRPLGGLKKEGAGPGSVLDFKYHYLDASERKLLWYAERFYFRTAK